MLFFNFGSCKMAGPTAGCCVSKCASDDTLAASFLDGDDPADLQCRKERQLLARTRGRKGRARKNGDDTQPLWDCSDVGVYNFLAAGHEHVTCNWVEGRQVKARTSQLEFMVGAGAQKLILSDNPTPQQFCGC